MPVKSILGFVFKADANSAVIEALDALSLRFDAHAACILGSAIPAAAFIGLDSYSSILSGDLLQYLNDALNEEEVRVRAALRRRGDAEFSTLESLSGDFERLATMRSRYSDLVVVRRPDARETAAHGELIDTILLNSGRPVLVVPPEWKAGGMGSKVVVAWDGSREAARSLGDAQELFVSGAEVVVVTVDAGDADTLGEDIALHLARHGLKAAVRNEKSAGVSVADVLLKVVQDQGADLLVMGGYRHSRMQQTLFGGVTRSVLAKSSVPLLLSH